MTDSRSDALKQLDEAIAKGGKDYAWADMLPEIGELPDGPDDTQAVMFPVMPPKV
jgi:hypothetical protein